jgi:hypothetical protein
MFEWVLGAVVVSTVIGVIISSLIGVDTASWPEPLPTVWPVVAIIVVLGVIYMFAKSAGLIAVAWPLGIAAFAPAILAAPTVAVLIAALLLSARYFVRLFAHRQTVHASTT